MAEGSGKQGVAKRTRAKRGKGSGCVCLQNLEGLQQRRLTQREPAAERRDYWNRQMASRGYPKVGRVIHAWLIQEKSRPGLAPNICGYATSGSKWTRPCARAPENRRRSAGVVGLLRHEAGGLE